MPGEEGEGALSDREEGCECKVMERSKMTGEEGIGIMGEGRRGGGRKKEIGVRYVEFL